MPFRDYVTALQTLLATTPLMATSLSYEERPPAGRIKGWLVFAMPAPRPVSGRGRKQETKALLEELAFSAAAPPFPAA